MNNQEALDTMKHHKRFEEFLHGIDFKKYPGLDLKKVFYFISNGTLVRGMPLDSTYKLMESIRVWLEQHSHGGARHGAGRPGKNRTIKKITLSAEEKDIVMAKARAKTKGSSLQKEFRTWLKNLK